jgi:hypothetical protein
MSLLLRVYYRQKIARRTFLAGLVGALQLSAVRIAVADLITLQAELNAHRQVPANKSAGTGHVQLLYDPKERRLTWKGSFSGLSGPVTAAHFHGPAQEGRNAGIALVISANGLSSPFEGNAILSPAQEQDLLAERWYINLHTSAFPAGEIRGQVRR